MHPSVEPALFPFFREFEGVRQQMYVDGRGLVTIGVGFMIEPVEVAVSLGLQNWYRLAGSSGPVTRDALADEIREVKSRDPSYQRQFGLRADAMGPLCVAEARRREHFLVQLFPDFATYPADAQMGIFCVSWLRSSIAGMMGEFPNFVAHCRARDFRSAGPESLWAAIRDATGDILDPVSGRRVRRRHAQLRMFYNAGAIEDANRRSPGSAPIERLWYPYMAPQLAAATFGT